MTKIPYHEDFPLRIRFGAVAGVPSLGVPDFDFTVRLMACASEFFAGRKDGSLYNCRIEDGDLIVVCDNHGLLPCAELRCEIIYHIPDSEMPDGVRDVPKSYDTGISLTVDQRDASEAEFTAMLPYIKGEKMTYADLSDADKDDLRRPAVEAAGEVRRTSVDECAKMAECRDAASAATSAALRAAQSADDARVAVESTESSVKDAESERVAAETQRAERFDAVESRMADAIADLGVIAADASAAEADRAAAEESRAAQFSTYGEEIDRAKRAVFDDLWTTAWGAYGGIDRTRADGHIYHGNGVYMTYEEAIEVWRTQSTSLTPNLSYSSFRNNQKIRTVFPIMWNYNGAKLGMVCSFFNCIKIEVICFAQAGILPSFEGQVFLGCKMLREIRGVLNMANQNGAIHENNFYECYALQEIRLKGLKVNLPIKTTAVLSAASLKYMVENSANGTKEITITVHPDVYAKLTDETNEEWSAILATALSRNILFAK